MDDAPSEFRVYRRDGTRFTYEGRDESQGIIGTLTSDEPPFGTFSDLASARLHALARLGVEPTDSLYLTDDHNRVLDILFNTKHHAEVSSYSDHADFSGGLLIVCATCLAAAAFAPLGVWALVAFAVAGSIYSLVVKTNFVNAFEGLIVVELCLLLTFGVLAFFSGA